VWPVLRPGLRFGSKLVRAEEGISRSNGERGGGTHAAHTRHTCGLPAAHGRAAAREDFDRSLRLEAGRTAVACQAHCALAVPC